MILMLVGFSTGLFPKTIIDDAGVSDALFKVACGLLVTHLGTLISRKEMAAQWKTVIISLMGVASIAVICLTLGTALFGFDNAVAAAPPLAGGAIATAMMSSAATEAGKTSAALVAIVCLSLQGLVGYPLTSFCLKKETKRLTKLYRNGEFKAATAASEEKKDEKHNFVKRERFYGSFSRSFDVSGINVDGIEAAYTDGVLTLTMPKKQELLPVSRRLEIK